ncbi:unnamed protein product [Ectocarpus sp. 13 AM-2016]
MIMSLGTSSLVIGHANTTQLVILGIALGITLYNAIVLEPSAVEALEEEQAVENKLRGPNKQKIAAQVGLLKFWLTCLGDRDRLSWTCSLVAVQCSDWSLDACVRRGTKMHSGGKTTFREIYPHPQHEVMRRA